MAVHRISVRLVLDDNFTSGIRNMAAATERFNFMFDAPRDPLWGVPSDERGTDHAPHIWEGDCG